MSTNDSSQTTGLGDVPAQGPKVAEIRKHHRPIFCVAPWVNSYRGTDGFRSLCCISTSLQADYQTFDEWWNSEEIRQARRTFLAGGIPPECSACVDSNRTSGGGYNQTFLTSFGAHIPDILAATSEDGRTRFQPRAIDYRTIHCNLRCRTCDARNSSSIRTEVVKHKGWLPPQAQNVDSDWWLEGGTLDTVEFVYWAGGEPLMSPVHNRVMQTLMETGRSHAIRAVYTSNLMHLNDRLLDDLARYSEGFGEVAIGASVDGLGDVGAYVRTGWDHEQFFKNVDLIRARAPRIYLYFDYTLTNIGFLSLPGLLHESAKRGMDLQCKLMECNSVNDFLHVSYLQPGLINHILNHCAQMALPLPHQKIVQGVRELLERRYSRKLFTPVERELVHTSEERRGMVGFFAQHIGPHLNYALQDV